ncbi:MAG: hypothetical protein F6J92_41900 [Symploca sp. SIO1A3]|nr:hypothetical protein [Symploca sp. SIO1A3]
MSENIKITMLGTTGAGKTCFMVGMYAVMQLGVHGFTLSAQDMDDDLELTDNWEQLTEGGENRFPDSTSKTYNFSFDFSYGFKKLMGFDWLDYRGGALRDKSTQADVQELEASLVESSCVFLCISGEHLTNKIESPAHALNLAKKTRADRMNLFLNKLREKRGPIPVVIAITKFDLCMGRKREDILEDTQKIFNALFTADAGWLVMICPVSLGKSLASDKVAGSIDPVNLHLPLIFAIYAQYSKYVAYKKMEEGEARRVLNQLQGKNRFMRWLNSDVIAKASSELQKNQAQANELQEQMALLAQELGRAKVYLNGKEQEISV